MSSKLKSGVSSLVHEVRSLNKSYNNMPGIPSLFGDEDVGFFIAWAKFFAVVTMS